MKEKSKVFLFLLLLLFTIFSSILIISTAARYNWDKSLSLLAGQFIKGHISLEPTKDLPAGDISIYNGKFYMYFGPLASIILMPFVALLGKNFPQIIIGIGTLFVSFLAVYSISRSFKFSKPDSLWLSLFFVFSTVLFSTSVINITSYLVEALGVPLILLSLAEYFRKKRPLLIGLFLGLAVLTRLTLILAVMFFVAEFIRKRLSKQQFLLLLLPFFLCLLFFGSYNYLRFHSFLETGYSYHIAQPFPLSKNFEYGEISLIHIPANLYSFLIMPPEPILYYSKGFVLRFPYLKANPWGMAIWFTSPLFLLLLYFKKNKYSLSSAIAAVSLAIPLFTYFSVGFAQFGYRYALDFLPFLFLLLIPSLSPKLSKTAITLITIGVIFNCLYITSLWGMYPHFGIDK
jgi:hypothetical protein